MAYQLQYLSTQLQFFFILPGNLTDCHHGNYSVFSVLCISSVGTHTLKASGTCVRILINKDRASTGHRMINITDTHITVASKANHQRKKNHCFTSTDSAGGGRSIFTPRGISVLWLSSP